MQERHREVKGPGFLNPQIKRSLIQVSQPSWSLGHKEIMCIHYVVRYEENLGVRRASLPSLGIDQSSESILRSVIPVSHEVVFPNK